MKTLSRALIVTLAACLAVAHAATLEAPAERYMEHVKVLAAPEM